MMKNLSAYQGMTGIQKKQAEITEALHQVLGVTTTPNQKVK